MGFFDEIRDRFLEDEEDDDAEEEYQAPLWFQAPEDQLAGVVPLELELARTDEAAIYLSRLAAYDCGFSFELHLLSRRSRGMDGFEPMWRARATPSGPPPDEVVRVGVEFADGRKAANLGSMLDGQTFGFGEGDDEPDPDPERDLSLSSGGGSSGGRHSQTDYWVWPLPPEGPVRFVCEWPLYAIPESDAQIEAEVILGAAQRAKRLWES